MTRMERYLKRRGMSVLSVASRAINPRTKNLYSRTHIYNVANGSTEPTRECMNSIVRAARQAANDTTIVVSDLFDIVEDQARRKAS